MKFTDKILVEEFRTNHFRNSFTEYMMGNEKAIPTFEVKVFKQMHFLNQSSTLGLPSKEKELRSKRTSVVDTCDSRF